MTDSRGAPYEYQCEARTKRIGFPTSGMSLSDDFIYLLIHKLQSRADIVSF